MSDRTRDWPIITALFVAITVTFIVSLIIDTRQQDQRARDAETAYVYACTSTNVSRDAVNETNDAIADFLEFLLPLVDDPDIAASTDMLIHRLRLERPPLDCRYPPQDEPPAALPST